MTRSFGWKRPTDTKMWTLEKEYEAVVKVYPLIADLRNWDSPVRDQGQEGSCVNFMLTAMMENVMNKMKLPFTLLSPQYPYYWVRRAEKSWPQDSGCMILDAVKVGAKWGFCPETDWPYKDTDYNKIPPLQAIIDGRKHLISGYYGVPQKLETMCSCIGADQFPVGNGIDVYSNFPFDTKDGVIPMPEGDVEGGHGIPLVGYNLTKNEVDSPTVKGERIPSLCFIFKNSWSTGWGHKGYGFLPIDYVLDHNLASEQVEILREVDKS